jgi:hypothetical protein
MPKYEIRWWLVLDALEPLVTSNRTMNFDKSEDIPWTCIRVIYPGVSAPLLLLTAVCFYLYVDGDLTGTMHGVTQVRESKYFKFLTSRRLRAR